MPGLPLLTPPRRRTSTEASRIALFREAAAIVDADPSRPITLDRVAQQVSSSPRQLRRAFSEVGGTTFGKYMRELRMARAAQLLTGTELPVHEISAAVGYTQPSQFTKAFRRSFGVAPTTYRLGERD
jgi:transcriptional regulator GlxA family with amidase domain